MRVLGTVFLVTAEPQTVSQVSSALGVNGRFSHECVFRELQEMASVLERLPTAAVLVDIDPQPAHILAEMDAIARRFSDARFIVLSKVLSSDLVLQSMYAGARHVLLKESIGSELGGVIQRFNPSEPAAAGDSGAVVSVLSASGGCGATTVAINLASELNLMGSEPALLIDLDRHYGAAAAYLGLQGQYGLADVLARKGQIDPQLIRSTACKYSDGLHVLLSPAGLNMNSPAALDAARLSEALEACTQAYRYTVVDAPRLSAEDAATLSHASLLNMMVMQLTVKDIIFARGARVAFSERGVPSERLLPVLNRHGSKHSLITLQEAEKSMGGASFFCIANDFRGAVQSVNFGQPLSEAMPRSPARRDVQQLARKVIEMHRQASGVKTPVGA